MIKQKDILKYIGTNAPVPYSYICLHFNVDSSRISQPMRRLKDQRLIKRVRPPNEGPLWILSKEGQRRFEYYIEREC